MSHNAALSGEQRRPPHLKYCAVNTETEANLKCQALGIRLKCFVIQNLIPPSLRSVAHFRKLVTLH
ncbi:hypothetical protein D8T57_20770 [Vibrio vulnificus]|nr:hypothetical protein D8T57_20770 [Vibrio vulnificus]